MRRTLLACAALSLFWLGCHRPKTPTVADAGTAAVDAGPPPPKQLSISLRVPQADGGSEEIPLQPGEQPSIDPVQKLEIVTNEPLRNERIRILDEADRVMASDEQLEETDAGIRDQVSLPQPLLGGHRYTLVLDGQNPGDVLDPEGHVVPEQRLQFQTTGEREQPPAPAKKKKPSRRRRHR